MSSKLSLERTFFIVNFKGIKYSEAQRTASCFFHSIFVLDVEEKYHACIHTLIDLGRVAQLGIDLIFAEIPGSSLVRLTYLFVFPDHCFLLRQKPSLYFQQKFANLTKILLNSLTNKAFCYNILQNYY